MASQREESPIEVLLDLLYRVLRRSPPYAGLLLALSTGLFFHLVWPLCWRPSADPLAALPRELALPVGAVARWLVPSIILMVWSLAELVKARDRGLPEALRRGGLEAVDWAAFERLVAEAFRRQGYRAEVVGSPDGDGGVDVILRRDRERVLVQCKHWYSGNVGVKPVRELYGVLCAEGATRAVLVSSGGFTAQARDFARGKPLELVDRRGLMAMLRRGGG